MKGLYVHNIPLILYKVILCLDMGKIESKATAFEEQSDISDGIKGGGHGK